MSHPIGIFLQHLSVPFIWNICWTNGFFSVDNSHTDIAAWSGHDRLYHKSKSGRT